MKDNFYIQKDIILEKLNLASRFLSSRYSSSLPPGVCFKIKKNILNILSSNLNSYYRGEVSLEKGIEKELNFVIEPKDVIEFINLLIGPKINFSIEEKKVVVSDEKNRGVFQRINLEDYPFPAIKEENKQRIDIEKWKKVLPQVLFSAATDESRPVLTGVCFKKKDDNLELVTTDGFRLSLCLEKGEIEIPSLIIPSYFLEEIVRIAKNKEMAFSYLPDEKMVCFQIDRDIFYTQLIEGEFPPYERVIPSEIKTKIIVDKEELFRNTKIVAVFARSFSNIVIFNIKKEELILRPKTKEEETATRQDITGFDGEEQTVAFNFKFILDFLNHIDAKEIEINVFKPDAPVVFKAKGKEDFIHIIMPVRMAE
jgi:DNA polymerase-3 subunit beta